MTKQAISRTGLKAIVAAKNPFEPQETPNESGISRSDRRNLPPVPQGPEMLRKKHRPIGRKGSGGFAQPERTDGRSEGPESLQKKSRHRASSN